MTMAKEKKGKSKPKKSNQNQHPSQKKEKHYSWDEDDSTMQQGLLVIVLFAIAVISLLSFINAAGDFGLVIDKILGWMFGWGRYTIPAIFAVLGYVFLHPEQYQIRIVNYIGLALFLLSGLALLHLFVPLSEIFASAKVGHGGGYLGIVLAYPFIRFTGVWATLVFLIGFFLASWLIMFNTSLLVLASRLRFFNYLINFCKKPLRWLNSRLQAKFYGYRIADNNPNKEEPDDDTNADATDEDDTKKLFATKAIADGQEDFTPTHEPEQMELIPKPKKRRSPKIDLPINLLTQKNEKPTSGNIEQNKNIIQETLASFGLEVEMGEVSVGPMVTQYTLRPAQGVKLTQITTLQNDIALALAAHPIRIEAPIPGKALVGVEVPNKTMATVTVRELIDTKKFKQQDNLSLCLGKDVSGNPFFTSLDAMPHLLIAGATGSGKSVCINSIIISLLYHNSPDDLRFIMIDPKRVELTTYNDIPHLMTPVITDVAKTINSLKWTVAEMERRYELLSRAGKRNIASYNTMVSGDEKLPYLVFIIDELADLMSMAAQSVEAAIVRLAQMSRAVGIHLILATQRPSVNVLTGLIKANMPARIAFSVASLVDSRTILDFSGAEKLLGRGDMLYIDAKISKPKRLQGAFVGDAEIERVVDYLRQQGAPAYESDVVEKQQNVKLVNDFNLSGGASDENSDELLPQAKEIILEAKKASASLLQRRLRIGYARAARILDILEEQGFIGPADGAKPRELLKVAKTETTDKIENTAEDIAEEFVQENSLEEIETENELKEDDEKTN